VDIGKDTTRFIKSRGFEIHQCSLEECGFREAEYDGIFVWNCFEQIPDPHTLLDEARRVLKPGGALVLRMPNALFYRVCQQRLKTAPDSELALWIVRALGYNNLLAFPYLYGYDSRSLTEVAEGHGFRTEALLNSELITLPFPELEPWIVEENRAAYALIRTWSELEEQEREGRATAPWMEGIFRRT
jgi:SAM-dependent methyltransferase